jgi:polyisoprenoid-binding protein YceI
LGESEFYEQVWVATFGIFDISRGVRGSGGEQDSCVNVERFDSGIERRRPAQTAPKAGESLAVTPENSKVLFTGSKVTGKHEGGFNKFNGAINLVNGKAEESSVSVDIETSSVFTDTDGLTKHLQTGDFFESEKFPKASFASTKIVSDSASGANNYTVTGDLELRGC